MYLIPGYLVSHFDPGTWVPDLHWPSHLLHSCYPGFCWNSGQVLWECLRAWPHLSHGQGGSLKGCSNRVSRNKLQVHWILNELVMGGMVLETNMSEIMLRIEEQNKIEKEEVRLNFSLIYLKDLMSNESFFSIGFLWRIFWSKICFVKYRLL